jgi:predicted dehydrogenase
MVRVAVTGLGFMGKTHLGIYNGLEGVEIAALCDKGEERVNLTSLDAGGNIEASSGAVDFSGVAKYTDYDAMLKAGGFDAVDICLPTDLHAEFAVKALDAGYHVFVEKPLALDHPSALKIAEAAERTGKVCAVGQCLRFWPAYTEVKKLIDGGSLGAVKHAEFSRFSPPAGWAAEGWLADPKRSGNASLDLHVHDVDMILWMFGAPRAVRSVGIPDGQGFFSHISTVYDYPDRSVLSTGGWAMSSSTPFNMRALFVLEKGVVDLDFARKDLVMVYPDGGDGYALDLPAGDGYQHELADFVARCSSGTPTEIVSPRVAAESVRLARIEIESAREGAQKTV